MISKDVFSVMVGVRMKLNDDVGWDGWYCR